MTPLKFIWKSSKRSTSILPEDVLTRLLCKRTHATLATLFKTILHSCPTHFHFENLKYNAIWRPQRCILGEDSKGRSKVIGRYLRSARRKARLTPVLAQGSPGSPAAQPALARTRRARHRQRWTLPANVPGSASDTPDGTSRRAKGDLRRGTAAENSSRNPSLDRPTVLDNRAFFNGKEKPYTRHHLQVIIKGFETISDHLPSYKVAFPISLWWLKMAASMRENFCL